MISARNHLAINGVFCKPIAPVDQLYRIEEDKLFLKGFGTAPVEGNLLTQISGDQHYEIEIELELDATVSAGLMLFYNHRLYAGIGFSNRGMIESSRGESSLDTQTGIFAQKHSYPSAQSRTRFDFLAFLRWKAMEKTW